MYAFLNRPLRPRVHANQFLGIIGRCFASQSARVAVHSLILAFCAATMCAQQIPVTLLAANRPAFVAILPDAPDASALGSGVDDSAQQPSPLSAGNSSISGTVEDANGGIVPGATVTLNRLNAGAPPVPRSATSSSSGQFTFTGLPPGTFQLTISAPSFETYVSSNIALHTAQQFVLAQIALPIATATSDVQVHVTQVELAHEQVKAEEKQRVLGVFPNFYSSYIWNAAPLTTGQKFNLAAHSVLDPVSFIGNGVAAGIQQWRNDYADYGQGAEGYGKRYGADFADGVIGRMMGSAILPTLFHQDPRYFYLGSGTKKQRVLYALTRSIITRGDNGQWQPNYSGVLGDLSAGAISNAYIPASDRGVGVTFGNAALNTAGNAFSNIVREFIVRGLVPSVPTYAQGRQSGPIPNPLFP